MRRDDEREGPAPRNPNGIVPPGHVLIGANYNAKTGDLKHTVLMNDDVDPGVLRQILDSLPRLQVKRRRFPKLRLPPQQKGQPLRSFKGRILLCPGHATSSFGRSLTQRIAQVVLSDLFARMGDALGDAAESA